MHHLVINDEKYGDADFDSTHLHSAKNEDAKMEIMKLYEQSKALNAAQVRAANQDSGISSAPSSAGGSVSSTDTNHGGSDEDLIDFHQTWRHSKYDNWPPGKHFRRSCIGTIVPTFVTAHTFCASRDTQVSYGAC